MRFRGSDYTPALVHFTETLHFVKQPFYISEPNFYVYACMEKKNGKTDKDMLGKLQDSSLAVCLKPPISENFPLSKTTYF